MSIPLICNVSTNTVKGKQVCLKDSTVKKLVMCITRDAVFQKHLTDIKLVGIDSYNKLENLMNDNFYTQINDLIKKTLHEYGKEKGISGLDKTISFTMNNTLYRYIRTIKDNFMNNIDKLIKIMTPGDGWFQINSYHDGLDKYKYPKDIVNFNKPLPKLHNGKLDRKKIKKIINESK